MLRCEQHQTPGPPRLRKGPSGCQAAWLNMVAFLAELLGQAPSVELDDVSWEENQLFPFSDWKHTFLM